MTDDDLVDRALDDIRPRLEALPESVRAMVLLELMTRWIAGFPAFGGEAILAEMMREISELAPDMEVVVWGPSGHPQKAPVH
jgi:hypothetical protein